MSADAVRVAQHRFPFDGVFEVDATPQLCWDALTRTDEYTDWWPWLRELDTDGGLEAGAVAHGVIKAPLPYTLEVDITVAHVEPSRRLDARISGDLAGPAALELNEHPDGTGIRITWDLELRAPLLRSLATVARPVMLWAHDRIIETGFEQFCKRAIVAPVQGDTSMRGNRGGSLEYVVSAARDAGQIAVRVPRPRWW
ncbi:MAG: SRPBCC family protein [Acidimicrobiia bacterium]|nr:SRPBCC family protein [Acidimicrobiia bacterium]